MSLEQKTDPNAELRKKRGFGSGWNSIGQFIGGAINAGFGAANGDKGKAQQGLSQMGSSFQGFSNQIAQNKQMSSGNLNLTDPNAAVPEGQAAKAASTGMDMGAGYNPQSETFRSSSGQTITDRNKTFEQQAANALMQNNTLMASKGRRINYLSFFN